MTVLIVEIMSAATITDEPSLNNKQLQILQYLRQNTPEQTYFKSRLIAEELDMSPKEVGSNMIAIAENDLDIAVEKWGYSSSTTWKVTSS